MVFALFSFLDSNFGCWVHGKRNDYGNAWALAFFTHNVGITSALLCFLVEAVRGILWIFYAQMDSSSDFSRCIRLCIRYWAFPLSTKCVTFSPKHFPQINTVPFISAYRLYIYSETKKCAVFPTICKWKDVTIAMNWNRYHKIVPKVQVPKDDKVCLGT